MLESRRLARRAIMSDLDPVVGQWYVHHDKGEMFRVVAADTALGSIEIQNFDGDIAEVEMDAWREMDVDTAEAPEDWTGPFDDVGSDNHGYTETAMNPQDWRQPLEGLAAVSERWEDESAG
jgi:hypothetical protein